MQKHFLWLRNRKDIAPYRQQTQSKKVMTVPSLIACDILPLNEKLWIQIYTRSLWSNSKFNLTPPANFIGENENKWRIKRITLIIHHSSNCSNKSYTSNKLWLNFSKWMEIQEKKWLCPILCHESRVSVKENPDKKIYILPQFSGSWKNTENFIYCYY